MTNRFFQETTKKSDMRLIMNVKQKKGYMQKEIEIKRQRKIIIMITLLKNGKVKCTDTKNVTRMINKKFKEYLIYIKNKDKQKCKKLVNDNK